MKSSFPNLADCFSELPIPKNLFLKFQNRCVDYLSACLSVASHGKAYPPFDDFTSFYGDEIVSLGEIYPRKETFTEKCRLHQSVVEIFNSFNTTTDFISVLPVRFVVTPRKTPATPKSGYSHSTVLFFDLAGEEVGLIDHSRDGHAYFCERIPSHQPDHHIEIVSTAVISF